jgi:exodeoxyribonuclease VII small subunit
MDHPEDKLTFEQAYAELEKIVAQLESGDLTLEDAVALYEQGQRLARLCGEMLDSAELRVQQVTESGEIRPLE